MTVVPARVAGVERIVVASPADRSGNLDPVLCGAAGLLEVEALIIAGGAQAVGSLAYGLPDAGIEPVDRIVGPGNAWVTAAKIEVSGEVAIDLPAGPSEGLVLADPPADPRRVALDLITQAEHGPDSPVLLVTTNGAFADAVELEIRALLVDAHRRDILLRSLAEHGRVVLAPDLDAAIAFANDYAPDYVFRNDGGKLVDVTHDVAGDELQGFGMGVSLGDYDNDGRQDPFFTYMFSKAGSRVTGMLSGLEKRMYEGVAGNKLLRNTPERFVNVTGEGEGRMEVAKTGWSWGGQFTDLDNDGFLDLYVANGFYTPPGETATEVDL